MFDTGGRPSAEDVARLDHQIERHNPSATPESAVLIERVRGAVRLRNQCAADRLVAVGELFAHRLVRGGEHEDWAVDTEAAVVAEVAAALCVSQQLAGNYLSHARAMREPLPEVAKVFRAGDLDYRLFTTIVYRTDLIGDRDVLAKVDEEISVTAPRWPSMTPGRLNSLIDEIVARKDADAVRRRRDRQTDRTIEIWDSGAALSEIRGFLRSTDGHALSARLDALAGTVCSSDPRSREQRRADAMGALSVGSDRLACECGRPECTAEGRSASPVAIHVVAEQATVNGTGTAPAAEFGSDVLIPAEMVAELAKSARLAWIVHPGQAAPEPQYKPSEALADHVRCRDITCRFPGCDKPAIGCAIDHTIPYGDGGRTHASKLKCLCRFH